MREASPGVVELADGRLATRNRVPGTSVYGEELVTRDGDEYRAWDPSRSKLAAALLKGLPELPFGPGDHVLYLGAGAGTTVSHVSDVVGPEGRVVAVDASPWAVRDLLGVAEARQNVIPVLADAREPQAYAPQVTRVDAAVQDIAQRRQARILLENLRRFRPPRAFLAVKARSVDVAADPRRVAADELEVLHRAGWNVDEARSLAPYEEAHTGALLSAPEGRPRRPAGGET